MPTSSAVDPVVSDRFAVVSAVTLRAVRSHRRRCSRRSTSGRCATAAANSRGLVELGTELERSRHVDDVIATLVRHTCGRLGFVRVAVLVRQADEWSGVVDDGRVEALLHAARPAGADRVGVLVEQAAECSCARSTTSLLDTVLPDASNVIVAPVAAEGEKLGVSSSRSGEATTTARIPTVTVQALAEAAMHTALALRNAQLLVEVERLATATRSPASPTVACSTSHSSGRRRGRSASARR